MIRRIFAGFIMIWALGFVWFSITLPGPMEGDGAQAAIVPTGAAGRIERGLEVLAAGDVKEMLVTGVDPEVRPSEFAAQFDVPMQLMECCVYLGFDAVDTRGNASEAAGWIEEHNVDVVRLVTTDWHMRRAAYELRRLLPASVTIVEDSVRSEPSLRILFLEYHKLLAGYISAIWRG